MSETGERLSRKLVHEHDVLSLFQKIRGSIIVDDKLLQRLMLHAGREAERVRGGLPRREAVRSLAGHFNQAFCTQLDLNRESDSERLMSAWIALANWSLDIELEGERVAE